MNETKAEFLHAAQLYVLTDSIDFLRDPAAPRLEQLIRGLIAAGVPLVQLRDKRLNDRQLVEVGSRIAALTRGSKMRFLMNDRVDLAILVNADGVHLGQEDLEIEDARRLLKSDKLIGISTHSLEQAQQATRQGADYIGIGPVFPSSTKSFSQFVGLSLVQSVAKAGTSPAFAIGGIDLTNVNQVIEAGLNRVAVSSAICGADNPSRVAEEFLEKLRKNLA